MKKYIVISLLFIVSAGCRHNEEKKERTSVCEEKLWEYINYYDNDSLLYRTIVEEYLIAGDRRDSISTRQIDYLHTLNGNEVIRTEAIHSSEDGNVVDITNYTPNSKEIISIEGEDTTSYELKVYDHKKRVVKDVSRGYLDSPYNGGSKYIYFEFESFFDEQDRLYRKISKSNTNYAYDSHREIVVTYKDDTETVISEKVTDWLNNEVHLQHYTAEQSGDTLIQDVYIEGVLSYKIKRSPGYMSQDSYYKGRHSTKYTEITNGAQKTVISWDIQQNTGDSIYYENDLIIREVLIFPDIESRNYYSYDTKGNMTEERQTIISYTD
ncbi:MAG: hypothetical protein LBV72_04760 [Tannerella sp.]|jgi:hypothetical protein|nr:hypothetical protein [Tannerella sp.]